MTVLVYLETGRPGEGDQALEDAPSGASVFFRTVRQYSGPEAVERVYTDNEQVQEDYMSRKASVRTLAGGVVHEGEDQDVGGIDLSDTEIGGRRLQDMTRDELYAMAQDKGVDGRSNMDKDELFQAIKETE